MFFGVSPAQQDDAHKVGGGQDPCNDIGGEEGQPKADLLTQQEGRDDKQIESAGHKGDKEGGFGRPLFGHEIDADGGKGKDGNGLIGPCEIPPQNVEALCIQFGKNHYVGNHE